MSMEMMATERVCYVHCNFCNTILAVQNSLSLFLSLSVYLSIYIYLCIYVSMSVFLFLSFFLPFGYLFPYSSKLSVAPRPSPANLATWVFSNFFNRSRSWDDTRARNKEKALLGTHQKAKFSSDLIRMHVSLSLCIHIYYINGWKLNCWKACSRNTPIYT